MKEAWQASPRMNLLLRAYHISVLPFMSLLNVGTLPGLTDTPSVPGCCCFEGLAVKMIHSLMKKRS